MNAPSRREVVDALNGAAGAHHEYETERLGGNRDDLWAGFYAAYLLGRFGDLATCSALVEVLESVTAQPWADEAADAILARFASKPS